MNEPQEAVTKAQDLGLPDYFDMQAAMGYTKHLGGWKATQELVQMVHLQKDQELLYVGCGAGTAATKIVQEYQCRLVGVDVLESMVESARDWAERRGVAERTDFRVADAQDLPFEDNRFDALICESVNTFVPDLDRAGQEYVRVVKPGGYVGLNEAVWAKAPTESGSKIMTELTGQRLRTSEEWVAMLNQAGLVNLESCEYALELKSESRSQLGFLSFLEYMGVLGRFLFNFLTDSHSRKLMRHTLSEPKAVLDNMAYGLYVGQKPGT